MTFISGTLDEDLAFLDGIPEPLLDPVMLLDGAGLQRRATVIATWRDELLAGICPTATEPWPGSAVIGPTLRALDELGLVRFCKGQEELVDLVLADLVDAITRGRQALTAHAREARQRLEEEELERLRAEAAAKEAPTPASLDAETRAVLAELAAEAAETACQGGIDDAFTEAWGDRVAAWLQIYEVFGDLAVALGLGWDLSAGILRHHGWAEITRLHALLDGLPQLRDIAADLGRLQPRDDMPPVFEAVLAGISRVEEEIREVRTPHARTETRGLVRSDDLARMLPSEAVLLTHPTLRLLWHARRAERGLLCYRVEGVAPERFEISVDDTAERLEERPRPDRGPILVCLDTSGSMASARETVAKAMTLEVLRVAHRESRRCILYAFSGPGQVEEQELDLTPTGLGRLLAFLGCSFHGGTDVDAPVRAALARLNEEEWERADVLMISDGEFPAPAPLIRDVNASAEDLGTRWHGLAVAGHPGGLGRLCDPVHRFDDWDVLLGG